MPNGGAGHCGGCSFNMRNQLRDAFPEARDKIHGNPGYCTLRQVVIPDVGYTYCDNCEYDGHVDESTLTTPPAIRGSLWVNDSDAAVGWDREPHNDIPWTLAEWQRWNTYVKARYPRLMGRGWLGNVSPW